MLEERYISRANHSIADSKIVYRRYASLFFIAGCNSTDNELITLEIVHRYVEQMDKYYGNVCELDIIFNFQKAYFILDELLLAGEMQESSKKDVLRCIAKQDTLEDMEVSEDFPLGRIPRWKDYSLDTDHSFWNLFAQRSCTVSSWLIQMDRNWLAISSFQVETDVTRLL